MGRRTLLVVTVCILALGTVGTVASGIEYLGGVDSPADERRFLQVVKTGREEARGENEIRVAEARKKRAVEMCDALPKSLAVSGWTGKIEEISTTMGGDGGVLSVALTDEVAVTTMNNVLSDIGARTIIEEDSDLYATLADLDPGTPVKFSGQFISGDGCVREMSVMDENGMATPDFLFKFTSVQKD